MSDDAKMKLREKCVVQSVSGRMCEMGTRNCVVKHDVEPAPLPPREPENDDPVVYWRSYVDQLRADKQHALDSFKEAEAMAGEYKLDVFRLARENASLRAVAEAAREIMRDGNEYQYERRAAALAAALAALDEGG